MPTSSSPYSSSSSSIGFPPGVATTYSPFTSLKASASVAHTFCMPYFVTPNISFVFPVFVFLTAASPPPFRPYNHNAAVPHVHRISVLTVCHSVQAFPLSLIPSLSLLVKTFLLSTKFSCLSCLFFIVSVYTIAGRTSILDIIPLIRSMVECSLIQISLTCSAWRLPMSRSS